MREGGVQLDCMWWSRPVRAQIHGQNWTILRVVKETPLELPWQALSHCGHPQAVLSGLGSGLADAGASPWSQSYQLGSC